jgi:hypothetical protein
MPAKRVKTFLIVFSAKQFVKQFCFSVGFTGLPGYAGLTKTNAAICRLSGKY